MSLPENLISIQQRIRAACTRAGRPAGAVTLLAVSKTHPPATIESAVNCGLRYFGENKVQEARAKIPLCPGKTRWHLIGHLQSNKVRDAVELFEMIQSVDSLSLARKSPNAPTGGENDAHPAGSECGGRSQQFGYGPEKLLAEMKELNALPRIEVHGLMAIPPFSPCRKNPARISSGCAN